MPERMGNKINWRFAFRTEKLLMAIDQPLEKRVKIFIQTVFVSSKGSTKNNVIIRGSEILRALARAVAFTLCDTVPALIYNL